jgi:hypothetical protein
MPSPQAPLYSLLDLIDISSNYSPIPNLALHADLDFSDHCAIRRHEGFQHDLRLQVVDVHDVSVVRNRVRVLGGYGYLRFGG